MKTPNLDTLAKEGVLFENAFVNNPVCMPSRHSMLTGLYPSRVGTTCNGVEMPEDMPHLATYCKAAGYTTANIGKLHFTNHASRDHSKPHHPYDFDTLILSDEPGCYDDDYIKWVRETAPDHLENCRCSTPPAWTGIPIVKQARNTHEPYTFEAPDHLTHSAFVAQKSIEFLKRQNENQPFLLICGFFAPHPPLNPPRKFLELYNPDELALPVRLADENYENLDDVHWRKVKQHYYALVSNVDEEAGKILKTLKDTGLDDNTIIVFTSDHGEYLGDHGMIQKGPPGLDSCIHVPLIISGPGIAEKGRFEPGLIEAVDLLPTLLDSCHIPIPDRLQGNSFKPILEKVDGGRRESIYVEFMQPGGESWKTIRTSEHKYCLSSTGEELMFDLRDDPGELYDIAVHPRYDQVKRWLKDKLLERWFGVENQYPQKTGAY